MSFMHIDAHTAAAGVAVPSLSGTAVSPNTAQGFNQSDGVVPSTATAGWLIGTNDYVQGSPVPFQSQAGSISRYDSDFGGPATYILFNSSTEWISNKSYTETYWVRATLESGDAPGSGYALNTWHDISPTSPTDPQPYWTWSASSKFDQRFTGTLKIEIARDNGAGAAGLIVATGYYEGDAWVQYVASGGGGGGCFTGNMLVLMADGSEKRIAEIVEGDMVVALADDNSFAKAKVGKVMIPRLCNVYEIKLNNGKVIETTAEHPFKTVGGQWVNIDPEATYQPTLGGPSVKPDVDGKLQYGTRLYGFENNAEVVKIKNTGRQETVYNLSNVGEHHTYFVEGMCVHNFDNERTVKN